MSGTFTYNRPAAVAAVVATLSNSQGTTNESLIIEAMIGGYFTDPSSPQLFDYLEHRHSGTLFSLITFLIDQGYISVKEVTRPAHQLTCDDIATGDLIAFTYRASAIGEQFLQCVDRVSVVTQIKVDKQTGLLFFMIVDSSGTRLFEPAHQPGDLRVEHPYYNVCILHFCV